MTSALVKVVLLPSQPTFDTSILAGAKSANTIEQYRMHFAAYVAFAGSWAEAVNPVTLTPGANPARRRRRRPARVEGVRRRQEPGQ